MRRIHQKEKPELRYLTETDIVPNRLIELAKAGIYYDSKVLEPLKERIGYQLRSIIP